MRRKTLYIKTFIVVLFKMGKNGNSSGTVESHRTSPQSLPWMFIKKTGRIWKLLSNETLIWNCIYSIIKNMFLFHICGNCCSFKIMERKKLKAKTPNVQSHTHTPFCCVIKGPLTSLELSIGVDICICHMKTLLKISTPSLTLKKFPKITHILSGLEHLYLSQLKSGFPFGSIIPSLILFTEPETKDFDILSLPVDKG